LGCGGAIAHRTFGRPESRRMGSFVVGGFVERTCECVGNIERGCVDSEVVAIEVLRLHADDAENIAPLTIGVLATLAIPMQLLQQNVLRRVDVKNPSVGELDSLASPQLLLVERRAASDKNVDLIRVA
jgi:hypothetical protein